MHSHLDYPTTFCWLTVRVHIKLGWTNINKARSTPSIDSCEFWYQHSSHNMEVSRTHQLDTKVMDIKRAHLPVFVPGFQQPGNSQLEQTFCGRAKSLLVIKVDLMFSILLVKACKKYLAQRELPPPYGSCNGEAVASYQVLSSSTPRQQCEFMHRTCLCFLRLLNKRYTPRCKFRKKLWDIHTFTANYLPSIQQNLC